MVENEDWVQPDGQLASNPWLQPQAFFLTFDVPTMGDDFQPAQQLICARVHLLLDQGLQAGVEAQLLMKLWLMCGCWRYSRGRCCLLLR